MSKMPSVMSHSFSQVPAAEIQRSTFERNNNLKTTFDSGYLIPIFIDEAMPGDTFKLAMTAFARLATPLHPYMDNVFLNSFFFFVPYRLLWQNFQKFMGEQINPGDSTDYLIPQMTAPVGGYANGTIYDYMQLPTQVAGFNHSSLPLRAYNLVWNNWFRDQNLQNSLTVPQGDTSDPTNTYQLMRRGKRHDYFTSSLPWPQKGGSVSIPLGTQAPITGLGIMAGAGNAASLASTAFGLDAAHDLAAGTPYFGATAFTAMAAQTAGSPPSNTNRPQVYADLTNATAATINSLRQAFAIQKLHERDARGGTRYTEIIRAHFNVVSPDARLQRPEYLGGGQSSINLYAVPQTSANAAQPTPQGNLAAYGTTLASGHGFSKSFTEHGVVLGLLSVRADLNYQQGLPRQWSRRTKYDFYWPALAHIGEQAVLMQEIYCTGTSADQTAWGYQERFAEYRYKPSVVTGQFRSNFAQTLDTWHLAQNFSTAPALNDAFIQDNPPIARVVAVTSQPQFIADVHFAFRCARPMPTYGIPGQIDRF